MSLAQDLQVKAIFSREGLSKYDMIATTKGCNKRLTKWSEKSKKVCIIIFLISDDGKR